MEYEIKQGYNFSVFNQYSFCRWSVGFGPCMYYGPVVWYLAYSIYFYVLRRIWLMIAKKIPGAWLSQIRDAGHGLMYRYPDNFSSDFHIFAVC
jgi:hypothetical protein